MATSFNLGLSIGIRNTWSLSLVPDSELSNPLEFLEWLEHLCSNEVTLGRDLDSFWMGAGCQKDQTLIRSLELSTPCPQPQRERREAKDWINNQSCLGDETPHPHINTPKYWGLEDFWVGEHIKVLGRWCIQRGHGSSAHISPSLPYISLLFDCFWVVSYNKLKIANKVPSPVLWAILANYQPEEGVVETPNLKSVSQK